MSSSLSVLRLFAVLAAFMALIISLFTGQVGAAAAQGAADAAAVAVADSLPADWDCSEANLPANTEALAAQTAAARTAQLANVQPIALAVRADPTCSVIVSLEVASSGWLTGAKSLAVACRRPPSGGATALGSSLPPPC